MLAQLYSEHLFTLLLLLLLQLMRLDIERRAAAVATATRRSPVSDHLLETHLPRPDRARGVPQASAALLRRQGARSDQPRPGGRVGVRRGRRRGRRGRRPSHSVVAVNAAERRRAALEFHRRGKIVLVDGELGGLLRRGGGGGGRRKRASGSGPVARRRRAGAAASRGGGRQRQVSALITWARRTINQVLQVDAWWPPPPLSRLTALVPSHLHSTPVYRRLSARADP